MRDVNQERERGPITGDARARELISHPDQGREIVSPDERLKGLVDGWTLAVESGDVLPWFRRLAEVLDDRALRELARLDRTIGLDVDDLAAVILQGRDANWRNRFIAALMDAPLQTETETERG